MGRISTTFKRLRWEKETALIPHLVVGHPSLESTRQVVPMMARQGADLIELGVPFSGTTAGDGSIERAARAAHQSGVTLEDCLGVAADARRANEVPLILRSYYDSIRRFGNETVADECAAAGLDGLIVPDLPLEVVGDLKAACESAGIDLVLVLAPTAAAEQIRRVAEAASGFIYCLPSANEAGAGAQGEAGSGTDLVEFVAQLREHTTLPLAIDFGTGTPQQVARASRICDGVVIAHALADLVESLPEDELIFGVGEYVRDLKAATLPGFEFKDEL